MSQSQQINRPEGSALDVAPTPQNTPLDNAVLSSRPANLGRPTVAAIGEGEDEDDDDVGEDVSGMNPASLLAQNPALMALAQARLGELVGRSSGYIESLPPNVKRRIDGLKGIHQDYSKLEGQLQREIYGLQVKYEAMWKPIFDRRLEIITGKAEPTDAEVEAGLHADSDDEDEEDEEEEGAKVSELQEDMDVAGVPEFWLTALRNSPPISEMITERDEEVMKHLIDIRLSYLEGEGAGFRLHFHFSPNDFFEDSELVKTYYYGEKIGYGGDFVYSKAEGQEIKWKGDKDLTKKIEIKKQRNKTTGRSRVIRKVVPTDSFFQFFKPPQVPTPEQLENHEFDDEELEALDARLEQDYHNGEELKEKVIPRAIDYFTGKALEYEAYDEDDEIDEYDEFDEEDDDDEE